MTAEQAFFRRTGPSTFEPTAHASGAWSEEDHHFAPVAGLMVHAIEGFRAEHAGADLQLGRISFDILGRIPMQELEIHVEVLRPGRTIELLQATLAIGGRTVITARAWCLGRADTADVAATESETIPAPDACRAWDMGQGWPGGYIAQLQARVAQRRPGRGTVWLCSPTQLIEGEQSHETARFFANIDAANGIAARQEPGAWAFPNVDLTVHLHRVPAGHWTGLDTAVTWGADGVGLTSSTLHDESGPVGRAEQILTLRRL